MLTEYERDWALYTKSTGGDLLMHWHPGDVDVLEHDGITYTRSGPIVKARTSEHARRLIVHAIEDGREQV